MFIWTEPTTFVDPLATFNSTRRRWLFLLNKHNFEQTWCSKGTLFPPGMWTIPSESIAASKVFVYLYSHENKVSTGNIGQFNWRCSLRTRQTVERRPHHSNCSDLRVSSICNQQSQR